MRYSGNTGGTDSQRSRSNVKDKGSLYHERFVCKWDKCSKVDELTKGQTSGHPKY